MIIGGKNERGKIRHALECEHKTRVEESITMLYILMVRGEEEMGQ